MRIEKAAAGNPEHSMNRSMNRSLNGGLNGSRNGNLNRIVASNLGESPNNSTRRGPRLGSSASIRRRAARGGLGLLLCLALFSAGMPVHHAGAVSSASYGLSEPDNVGAQEQGFTEERYPVPDEPDHILDAVNFGVIANDGYDDTLALDAVLQAAKQHADLGDSVHIRLPAGQLDFMEGMAPGHPDVGILLDGLRNVALSGNTLMMFHGEFRAIELRGCENVLLHGITLDYSTLPFSMGTLTYSDGSVLEVTLDPGYPAYELIKVAAITEFDPVTYVPRKAGNDLYGNIRNVTVVGPSQLRIELLSPIDIAPVGTILALRHHLYGMDGITAKRSDQLYFEQVTLHTALGMGFAGYSSSNLYFNRFNIVVPANSGRLMTTVADGLHLFDTGGEVVVENSIFEYLGDDALNAHGSYLVIKEQTGPATVHAANPRGYNFAPHVGDTVELSDPYTMLPELVAEVVAVEPYPQGPGFLVTLDQPLPATAAPGYLIGNASRTPRLEFTNNVVRNKRSRGILIQTRDVLVENNTFANISNGAILIMTEVADWNESIRSEQVIIRNNKLAGNNTDKFRTYGDIAAVAVTKDYQYGQAGVFRDLVIENNFIAQTGHAGIYLHAVDGAEIRNNLLYQTGMAPARAERNNGIGLSTSRNITVAGNHVMHNGSAGFIPLYLGPGTERSTIDVTGNTGSEGHW